jgi:hypothetical protein
MRSMIARTIWSGTAIALAPFGVVALRQTSKGMTADARDGDTWDLPRVTAPTLAAATLAAMKTGLIKSQLTSAIVSMQMAASILSAASTFKSLVTSTALTVKRHSNRPHRRATTFARMVASIKLAASSFGSLVTSSKLQAYGAKKSAQTWGARFQAMSIAKAQYLSVAGQIITQSLSAQSKSAVGNLAFVGS